MALDKQKLITEIYNWTRNNSPFDTGNLREKGFFGPYIIGPEHYFVVGGDLAIYGPILNNMPFIRTKSGKTFPNVHYKWVENRVREAIAMAGAVEVEAEMENIKW